MSHRSRRPTKAQPKIWPANDSQEELQRIVDAAIERRLSSLSLPPGAQPRAINQDALMQTMTAQQAPAKQGTPMFAPGAPIAPQPGMVLPDGPRQMQ